MMRRKTTQGQGIHLFSSNMTIDTPIGLEIGGPSETFRPGGIFPIYPLAARIDNCNFRNITIWEGDISEGDTFIFDPDKAPGRQYIAEASNLQLFKDSSYDFVLSSHCIEHMANPLQGLAEWIRILKQHGLMALIVPHKDGTFDHRRPVTSINHLIQDLERQTNEGDMTHLEEILSLHDLEMDPPAGGFEAFRQRSLHNQENRCLHHHVFDTRLAIEVINYMKLQILTVALFQPFHIVILAKKVGQSEFIDNRRFRGIDSSPCWLSPFPSDQSVTIKQYGIWETIRKFHRTALALILRRR